MTPAATSSAPTEDLALAAVALARRFAAGATMWCVAPEWPAHGRHIAVEFVHPVIVGKRALPAVHVSAADAVGATRLLARPGDVVLAVGSAGDRRIIGLLRRSEAWGLTTFWLGAGAPPPAGSADHVVWAPGEEVEVAPWSGELVMLYHLLWELTHVVFEHPGLLDPEPPVGAGEVCATCSDEGRLAEVAVVHRGGTAEVTAGGTPETVDISLIDPVAVGDLVVVHAGVAITVLPEVGP